MSIWEALKKVEERFGEIDSSLLDPKVTSDPRKIRDLSKERAQLSETMRTLGEFRKVDQTITDDKAAVDSDDAELAEFALAELPELEAKREKLEGDYTLDADCTGTMTFGGILNPSSNVHWDLYVTEDHKRGHIIRMDEGNMAIRSFEK